MKLNLRDFLTLRHDDATYQTCKEVVPFCYRNILIIQNI